MSAASETLPALEQRLAERLLDSELLEETWLSDSARRPTGSLEGAMVQIMLAHAAADVMEADRDDGIAAVQMRTISKLLYSALTVIEQVASVPREEVAGEAYMRRDLDPHALVAGGEAEGTA